MNLVSCEQLAAEDHRFVVNDEVTLNCHFWNCSETPGKRSTAKRNIVLVHGACEHGKRYEHFAECAVDAGWNLIVPDLRGHGLSSGDVVHVDRFDEYLHDLHFMLEALQCDAQNTLLLGHSMGGLIVIRYLQEQFHNRQDPLCKAAMLSSPFLGLKLPVPAWKQTAGRILSSFLPKTKFRSTIKPEDLTHHQEMIKIRKADQLIRNYVTARWFVETNKAVEEAFDQINNFQHPCFILQAGEDKIADPLATKAWVERVNQQRDAKPVQLQVLRGWYHEVLRETIWKQAAKQFLEFADQDFSGNFA